MIVETIAKLIGSDIMFDEFFYRRRKNKGIYFLMISFLVMAVLLVVAGIAYVLVDLVALKKLVMYAGIERRFNTMSRILISGYYGFNNAGDDVVLYGIISSLNGNNQIFNWLYSPISLSGRLRCLEFRLTTGGVFPRSYAN